MEQVKTLRRLPAFCTCPLEVLKEVAGLLEARSYAPGAFIFRQGDAADCMYFLSKGEVKMLRRMQVPADLAHRIRLVRFLTVVITRLVEFNISTLVLMGQ